MRSHQDYEQLPNKYEYDALVVYSGAFVSNVINDQATNSQRLRWVQTLSAGIESYVRGENFRASEHIMLTNAKGAYSHILGEFIALGMLYHSKKVEKF